MAAMMSLYSEALAMTHPLLRSVHRRAHTRASALAADGSDQSDRELIGTEDDEDDRPDEKERSQ